MLNTIPCVASSLVEEKNRLNFLPKHLGVRWMMKGEALIFNWMGKLSNDYRGGFWNFYDLSNDGFFMAPRSESQFFISVTGNGFEDSVSAEAAGIITTLYALNSLMCIIPENSADLERIVNSYYLLRDFAIEHSESGKIFAAID